MGKRNSGLRSERKDIKNDSAEIGKLNIFLPFLYEPLYVFNLNHTSTLVLDKKIVDAFSSYIEKME